MEKHSIGMHLLRHYPYVPGKEADEFRELVLKSNRWVRLTHEEEMRMCEIENRIEHLDSFNLLPEKIRHSIERVMHSPKRTLLCFNPMWSRREIDTAKDLARTFAIPKKHVSGVNIPSLRDQDDLGFVTEFKRAVNAILVRAFESNEIEEIVLVGRRSYSYAFSRLSERTKDISVCRSAIEDSGVISHRTEEVPKIAEIYDFLKTVWMASSRRSAEKEVRNGKILLNGELVFHPRTPLFSGDCIGYRNRRFIIGVDEYWDPTATQILVPAKCFTATRSNGRLGIGNYPDTIDHLTRPPSHVLPYPIPS